MDNSSDSTRVCLKLDQGFKAVLRAFRSYLAKTFNTSPYQKGHHHWLKSGNESRWFERVGEFLTSLDISFTSKKELAIVILLVFPAFGPSSGSMTAKDLNTKTEVYRLLKNQGMRVFKTSITTNNNEGLRDQLFEEPIIQKLWKKLVPKMTLNDIFGDVGPNDRISPTYSEISKIMQNRYGLPMCKEWLRDFPII